MYVYLFCLMSQTKSEAFSSNNNRKMFQSFLAHRAYAIEDHEREHHYHATCTFLSFLLPMHIRTRTQACLHACVCVYCCCGLLMCACRNRLTHTQRYMFLLLLINSALLNVCLEWNKPQLLLLYFARKHNQSLAPPTPPLHPRHATAPF